jgi:hypothetical protein
MSQPNLKMGSLWFEQDSHAGGASNQSPREFPVIREFNREFCNSEPFVDDFGTKNRCVAATCRAILYSSQQGNYFGEQGFLIQNREFYLQINDRNDDAPFAGHKAVMGAVAVSELHQLVQADAASGGCPLRANSGHSKTDELFAISLPIRAPRSDHDRSSKTPEGVVQTISFRLQRARPAKTSASMGKTEPRPEALEAIGLELHQLGRNGDQTSSGRD